MKKTMAVFMAIMLCAVVSAVALVGCGSSGSSSSAASNAASSAASSTAASSAATAAAVSSSAAADSAARGSGPIINIDGVDVKDISFDMVGDTPNFMIIFSNTTDKDIEVDLSKFKAMVDDKDEVSFHLTKKTIAANTPYAQNAFTASANSMKVGDKVTLYYGDENLGVFEVQEF